MVRTWYRRVMIMLAFVGAFIAAYLVTKTNNPSQVVCSLGGHCGSVLSSKYAHILGLPISGLGLFWFVAVIILLYLTYFQPLFQKFWLALWLLAGLGFMIYLFSIETFVLHEYCTWCVGVAIIVLFMNILFFAVEKGRPLGYGAQDE
ncbi:MAG TPA: vitamin K epoxide reductase family protein [Candidatus Saccharimonadales bacterium]|nr:vitamin K epoxide reductase family protein [Candidatus Saccharimonadales bacterium]